MADKEKKIHSEIHVDKEKRRGKKAHVYLVITSVMKSVSSKREVEKMVGQEKLSKYLHNVVVQSLGI